jgi:hypothetical protein
MTAHARLTLRRSALFAYREALQFDLSSIPAGVSVTSASLGVFYDQACIAVSGNKLCGGNNHEIDVHQMTAPWSTSSTTSQVRFSSTVLSSFQLTAGMDAAPTRPRRSIPSGTRASGWTPARAPWTWGRAASDRTPRTS